MTISTGMIGQGVVNFGPFFGVLAAGRQNKLCWRNNTACQSYTKTGTLIR